MDFSDNAIVFLEGFPKLNRLNVLLMNNNRITRIGRNLQGRFYHPNRSLRNFRFDTELENVDFDEQQNRNITSETFLTFSLFESMLGVGTFENDAKFAAFESSWESCYKDFKLQVRIEYL